MSHSPRPTPPSAHFDPHGRGRAALLLLVGGALIGWGHWPGMAAASWVGAAVVAGVLRLDALRSWRLFAALLVASLARFAIAHPWHLDGLALYLPGGRGAALAAVLPIAFAWVLPGAALVFAGAIAAKRWRWPVWAWLPVAWIIGEALQDALWGLSHDDWLYAQWQLEPVLRVLGRLGGPLTTALALGTCAIAAEALATRSRRAIALGAAAALGWLLAPPLPASTPTAFAGVGAVHMADTRRPPRSAPPGVSLLVWPELTTREKVPVAEGASHDVFAELPFRAPGVRHLLGTTAVTADEPRNAVVALAADGEVLGMRAKRRLFPVSEQSLGLWRLPGRVAYRPGTAAPVLDVADRRVGVLICLELFDRGLIRAARAAGATLLVAPSGDRILADSELARAQILGAAVIASVESGLPVVRASMFGPSAFITPDGRVLAASPAGVDGVLTIAGDHPEPAGRAGTHPAAGAVTVLYSRHTPSMLPALACDDCSGHAIESFKPRGERAETVILSGDSMPPRYLGRPAAEVARAIASFHPSLVVLDTCYGASTPLLDALAAAGVRAHVVGPAFRIPASGLVYADGFLEEPDPLRRAAMIGTDPVYPLFRAAVEPAPLRAVHRLVDAMPPDALRDHLQRSRPPLVRVHLPGRRDPSARLVVPVPAERFRVPRRRA